MGIALDRRLCIVNECTLCLQECPQKVFGRFPEKPQKYVLSKDYSLEVVFPEYCMPECTLCMEVCPVRALDVGSGINSQDFGRRILLGVIKERKTKIAAGVLKAIFSFIRRR